MEIRTIPWLWRLNINELFLPRAIYRVKSQCNPSQNAAGSLIEMAKLIKIHMKKPNNCLKIKGKKGERD